MLFQIVIFAAIAGFFLYRLYTVLGRRTGHEPEPGSIQKPQEAIDAPKEGPRPAFTGPAAAGMEAIRRVDKSFDPDEFLNGAKGAYEMIVTAFAEGDRDTLKRFTASNVYDRYEKAIAAREVKDQKQVTDIVRIAQAEIESAELVGKTARVKVHFEADLATVVTDKDGQTIEGDASQIVTTTEGWTFERDAGARDPNWVLARVSRG